MAASPTHEGEALRGARERLGLSLEDAAEATLVPRRYLEALEREAPLEDFPAAVYGRAFLREYGRYLGLDPEPLLAAFNARNGVGEVEIPAARTVALRSRRRGPGLLPVLGGLLVVAAAVVTFLLLARHNSSGPGSEPSPRATATATLTPSATAHPTPTPRHLSRAIHVVLRLRGRCWIRATADGRDSFPPKVFPIGKLIRVRARRTVEIRLGDAGAVVLRANGKRIPTGPSGAVIDIRLALERGRVVRL